MLEKTPHHLLVVLRFLPAAYPPRSPSSFLSPSWAAQCPPHRIPALLQDWVCGWATPPLPLSSSGPSGSSVSCRVCPQPPVHSATYGTHAPRFPKPLGLTASGGARPRGQLARSWEMRRRQPGWARRCPGAGGRVQGAVGAQDRVGVRQGGQLLGPEAPPVALAVQPGRQCVSNHPPECTWEATQPSWEVACPCVFA